MQKEPDPQFKFTPQVTIIMMIVFIAMAIPIACIILGVQGYFQKPPPPIDPAAFAPLQKSLEDIADKSFETTTTLASDSVLNLTAPNLDEASKSLEQRAATLGGLALRSGSAPDSAEVQYLVQIPTSAATTFRKSPLKPAEGEGTHAPSADEARDLITVVIKKSP